MGIYLHAYETNFNILSSRQGEENLWDFIIRNSSKTLISLKSNRLIDIFWCLELASKYIEDKTLYFTFFDSIHWTTYDSEDEIFIDKIKYSDFYDDDLGLLKNNRGLYWKSFNYKTLTKILNDFKLIDFNLIQRAFELYFIKNKEEEIIKDAVIKLKNYSREIIEMYQKCILNKKDLIITYN